MNRREMIKMAYQTPPKNEVVDEIDKLFKQAALIDDEWMKVITSDPMLSKSVSKLPPEAKKQVLSEMAGVLSGAQPQNSAIAKAVELPVLSRLRDTGYLPSTTPVGVGSKIKGIAGKTLMAAAPIMTAGAGLYGLSNLINYVKDKSKASAMEKAKNKAFEQLSKDPSLKEMDKKELKQVFDLYSDVSPMIVDHPILASALLKDLGGTSAAVNATTLKSLGEIYKNREQALDFGAKRQQHGWMLAASDPSKLRNLIGSDKGN